VRDGDVTLDDAPSVTLARPGIDSQGGFIDPFGKIWLAGDKSPLDAFPER
jgi:hypothetical protein